MAVQKAMRKGERTSLQILEATARTIAKLGIERTTITTIAEEAAVTRSLVGHYFPVKDQMFIEVLGHIVAESREYIESMDTQVPPEEQILEAARRNLNFWVEHEVYFKCMLLAIYKACVDRDFRQNHFTVFDRAIKRFEALLEPLIAQGPRKQEFVQDFAHMLHTQLLGMVQKYFIGQHQLPPKEFIDQCMGQFRLLLGSLLSTGNRS